MTRFHPHDYLHEDTDDYSSAEIPAILDRIAVSLENLTLLVGAEFLVDKDGIRPANGRMDQLGRFLESDDCLGHSSASAIEHMISEWCS